MRPRRTTAQMPPHRQVVRASVRTSGSSNEVALGGRSIKFGRADGRTQDMMVGIWGREPSALSLPCASSWPFLALPAANDGPRGIGELC
jgi:hypothetical protein